MGNLTIDKLIGPLIHRHKSSQIDVDGDIDMGTNCLILQDENGVDWCLTVNTDGSLVTTVVVTGPQTGEPMGLLLVLTQS